MLVGITIADSALCRGQGYARRVSSCTRVIHAGDVAHYLMHRGEEREGGRTLWVNVLGRRCITNSAEAEHYWQ
jgi:hypothetical protein